MIFINNFLMLLLINFKLHKICNCAQIMIRNSLLVDFTQFKYFCYISVLHFKLKFINKVNNIIYKKINLTTSLIFSSFVTYYCIRIMFHKINLRTSPRHNHFLILKLNYFRICLDLAYIHTLFNIISVNQSYNEILKNKIPDL